MLDGRARREDSTGSTITVTSLGKLGAIATTPLINPPEVAIVGVNRMGHAAAAGRLVVRAVEGDEPVLQLRSGVIDGWAAAKFVARCKELLETPALLFVESGPHYARRDCIAPAQAAIRTVCVAGSLHPARA